MMKVLVRLARDSLVTALTVYGFLTLIAVFFPSFGSASKLWLIVPITFVIQFGLKLLFSRDENGRLRSQDG